MRILFLTDTHFGQGATHFQVQPRRAGGEAELLARLAKRHTSERIDLLIHGGDAAHTGDPALVDGALRALASLPWPVVLCPGNHDLTATQSLDVWRRAAGAYPSIQLADCHVAHEDCDIYCLSNSWLMDGQSQPYWRDPDYPVPALPEAQAKWLDGRLAERGPDQPAIVAIHNPPGVVAPDVGHLRNRDEILSGVDAYARALNSVLDRHPRVKLVLSGHVHYSSASSTGRHFDGARRGRPYLSTGAFAEPPYPYRVIEVVAGRIRVATRTLAQEGDWDIQI